MSHKNPGLEGIQMWGRGAAGVLLASQSVDNILITDSHSCFPSFPSPQTVAEGSVPPSPECEQPEAITE